MAQPLGDGCSPCDKPDIDEYCQHLKEKLFDSGDGSPQWDKDVILDFTYIFDEQHYYVTTYGIGYRSILPTRRVVGLVRTLLCNKWFTTSIAPKDSLDLEVHLRCVVAALRLVSAHGIQTGSGALTYSVFDELYRQQLPRWQKYYDGLGQSTPNEKHIKNYNNEFLLVYIRDLLSSMPNDRTIVTHLTSRFTSAIAFLGYAYNRNIVDAGRSLRNAVQTISAPSEWHTKYRTMDDLCLFIRVFRHYHKQTCRNTVAEWGDNFGEALDDTETDVFAELIHILEKESRDGLQSSNMVSNVLREGSNALNNPPRDRQHHFVFAILDLIQHHVQTVKNGKIHKQTWEVGLRIAKDARYSYLRCKAFELLATMMKMTEDRTEDENFIRSFQNWHLDASQEVQNQWSEMVRRVSNMHTGFWSGGALTQSLGSITTSIWLPATIKHIRNVRSHIEYVGRSLECPFGIVDNPDEDLCKLPCGHTVTLRAWQEFEIKAEGGPLRCILCRAKVEKLGDMLDMTRIRNDIREIGNCCDSLEYALRWDGDSARPLVSSAPPDNILDRGSPPDGDLIDLRREEPWVESKPDEQPRESPVPPPLLTVISNPTYEGDGTTDQQSPLSTPGNLIDIDSDPLSTPPLLSPILPAASPATAGSTSFEELSPLEEYSPLNFLYRNSFSTASTIQRVPSETTSIHSARRSSVFKTFSIKPNKTISLCENKIYKATAISFSGRKLVLIDKNDFVVRSIPSDATPNLTKNDFPLVCRGFSDGRYGKDNLSSPSRENPPTYSRVAIGDSALCIACKQGNVDIHDASTGQRLHTILPEKKCWNLAISPNEHILALMVESDEVLLYLTGPNKNFDTTPIYVIKQGEETKLQEVNCVTFSPDSMNISIATFDNVVRTFTIDVENHSCVKASTYDRELPDEACEKKRGITDIKFSSDSNSLLIVAWAPKTYPVLLKNATRQKELRVKHLGKEYKDNICRIAFVPFYNAALMISRTGSVKVANFAAQEIYDLDAKKMDDYCPWRFCSVGFSENGSLGLVLDRKANLLAVRFTPQRR